MSEWESRRHARLLNSRSLTLGAPLSSPQAATLTYIRGCVPWASPGGSVERMRDTTVRHVVIGLAAALTTAAGLHFGAGLPILWSWLAAINAVTLAMYAYDKRRAGHGGWRVPENALHALALVGGSPGALLAQRVLRHKTAKRSFQIAFWFICAVQAGLLIWWHAR